MTAIVIGGLVATAIIVPPLLVAITLYNKLRAMDDLEAGWGPSDDDWDDPRCPSCDGIDVITDDDQDQWALCMTCRTSFKVHR